MQACVLHAIGDLRCEQINDPSPRAGEVLVRVGACGVCGSDIPRVFKTGTYRFPLIPGHEFAGEIVAVGDDVDRKLLGRRATIFPLIPCRACPMCDIGEFALCANYDYLGSRSNGAFAEYVCAPAWNVVSVPGNVSIEEAAMTEPAAVALHALRQGEMKSGDDVLIFGAGPIGLLVALWARALGARKITLADIDGRKLEFAKQLDFADTYKPVQTVAASPGESISSIPSIAPLPSLVIEASGSAAALEQCMHAAAPFARVVLLGNPAGDIHLAKQNYWAILRKQLRVVGSWNSSFNPDGPDDDWKQSLEYMANGKLDVKPLITHRVGLPQLLDAMTMIRDRAAFSNKVMFVNE
ncbi:MAG: galactitol-1-phosphate 5-dehydrogenase [Candidatus Hydrogenedentes bacterium]|nr:galactitol-1-phosphate 5-dehydrogenase [Candidatus Hydrogenedentota bacterium]